MIEFLSLNVILASTVSGTIVGFTLRSNFENRVRANEKTTISFSYKRLILNDILWFLIISFALTIIPFFILKAGNSYPLSMNDRYVFVFCLFLSGSISKFVRYYYWKKKKVIM